MTAQAIEAPALDIDFFNAEVNADPAVAYERVREAGPVVYNPRIDQYMVTGHRLAARMKANARSYATVEELFRTVFGGRVMPVIDGPLHDELRGVWARDFQRGTLDAQRAMVQEVVDGRLLGFVERVRSGETVDAVAEMTRGIPALVIARMLGIPGQMFEQFVVWSDLMSEVPAAIIDPSPAGEEMFRRGLQATAELNAFVGEEIEARRASPTDDLISAMALSDVGRALEEQDLLAAVTQLVFAGNETTAKLMAQTLVALARHPDQRRALVEDRSLIPQAVEEVHRWHSVIQLTLRDVQGGDVIAGGVRIPDGARVALLLGACNRDPERWTEPERFDIHRERLQHLGFGFGMHVCLGLNLARLEVQVWLDRLLDLLPEFEIAGDVPYGHNFALRGPLSVPLAG